MIKTIDGTRSVITVESPRGPTGTDTTPERLCAPDAGSDGTGARYASEARAKQTPGPLRAYEAHRMMDANEVALLAASTAPARRTQSEALLAAMRGQPSVATVLEYLAQRFTPRTDDTIVDAADFPQLLRVSFDTIAAGGETAVSAFTEQVLFNFEDPADYRHVAAFVAASVPAATFAYELLTRIEGDNPLHIRNAAALAYATLGYGVTLSPRATETIELARLARLTDATLHPLARSALEDLRLPL